VEHALILEEVAHMVFLTEQFDTRVRVAPQYLQDKHYRRKHGEKAYYGQK
jgi:L-ribulose-5-phosphate 4-epimerase